MPPHMKPPIGPPRTIARDLSDGLCSIHGDVSMFGIYITRDGHYHCKLCDPLCTCNPRCQIHGKSAGAPDVRST